MVRYTVVWHPLAEDELADNWTASADRQAIADAANQIDMQLSSDADEKGSQVSERSRELTIPPLQVSFRFTALRNCSSKAYLTS